MAACALSLGASIKPSTGLTCRAGLFTTPVNAGKGEDILYEFAAAPPDAHVVLAPRGLGLTESWPIGIDQLTLVDVLFA
jgi:hypothetical protein